MGPSVGRDVGPAVVEPSMWPRLGLAVSGSSSGVGLVDRRLVFPSSVVVGPLVGPSLGPPGESPAIGCVLGSLLGLVAADMSAGVGVDTGNAEFAPGRAIQDWRAANAGGVSGTGAVVPI